MPLIVEALLWSLVVFISCLFLFGLGLILFDEWQNRQ